MPNENKRSLAGKVALVTGASRGIGRAIAQRLAAGGAAVVATARSLDQAKAEPGTLMETVALIETNGGRAIALAADIERAEDREALIPRAVQAAGALDILVNNAGYADYAKVENMTDATFERTITHYLGAPFVLSRAAIPYMRARGAGWIVNVGSVTALPPAKPYRWFDTDGGSTMYAAVKAAMHRFTQGLAAELLASNIAVNVVSPSTAIRTPGAVRYIPKNYPGEDIAYLAETAFQLCLLPAAQRTGLIAYSMHFPAAMNFRVYSVDGKSELPPAEIPAWSHSAINPTGE